jgi:hypothetical protein
MANLPVGDPRLTLAKHIDEGVKAGGTKEGETPHSCIGAAMAWNAFYSGNTLKILRTGSKFHLLGTIWRLE